jgi:hypothetical protein
LDADECGIKVADGEFSAVSLSSDEQVAAVVGAGGLVSFYHLHSLLVARDVKPVSTISAAHAEQVNTQCANFIYTTFL